MTKLPQHWRERLELVATCEEANCQGVAFVQYELRFRKGETPQGHLRHVASVCVSPNKQGCVSVPDGLNAWNHPVQLLYEKGAFAWVEELDVHARYCHTDAAFQLLTFLLCQYGCIGTNYSASEWEQESWKLLAVGEGSFHTVFWKSLLFVGASQWYNYSFNQPHDTTWVWSWSDVCRMIKDGRQGYLEWEEAHLESVAAA